MDAVFTFMAMENFSASANAAPPLTPRAFSRRIIRLLPVLWLLVGISAGMFIGLSFAALDQPDAIRQVVRPLPIIPVAGNARQLEGVDFKQFWQVWDYVKTNYVHDDLTDTKLFYGALHGIVGSLDDPYSVFFEPTTSAQFQQDLSGSFEGIGAEIGIRHDQLTIIAPLPGNPAERAGLKAGDVVLMIDEVEAVNLPLDIAVHRIRGPKGTNVRLKILRTGEQEPRTFAIQRDTIAIVSVSWQQLPDGLAQVQLKYFNEDTLSRFAAAAQQIVAAHPHGIILDLRNNPGGFLTTAIEVASFWTGADRVVVGEQQRDRAVIGHRPSNQQALFEGIPTVVLINRGSASGSEIVAGALQDYQLATLVGETSFGKGSVQDLRQLADGSSVKLTIAKWLTPQGRQIEGTGITPDVEVKAAENDSGIAAGPAVDPQLEKAIELLRAGSRARPSSGSE